MVERGLDPAEQCWVFIIDCYSVHISREFLEWARFTYPNMFLLYIFAGCTAWLQPLDISFNGVFKSILRQQASLRLCQYMQDQLQLNGGDPSKVTLDLTLTFLKPLFCHWLSNAHSLMAERHSVIKRGWDESGMGRAMELADEENGFDRTTPEFLEALALQEEGTLWEKFTDKKFANIAETALQGQFDDLFGMQAHAAADIAEAQAVDIGDALGDEAVLEDPIGDEDVLQCVASPDNEAMFQSLELQCQAYERTLLTDILKW